METKDKETFKTSKFMPSPAERARSAFLSTLRATESVRGTAVSGFANADGGKLSVGLNDDGHPVGLANAQGLLEEIPNKIRNILGIIAEVNLRGISPLATVNGFDNPEFVSFFERNATSRQTLFA